MRPTPCKPPETLYPPLPNFPPACSIVNTTSTAGIPALWLIPTASPRKRFGMGINMNEETMNNTAVDHEYGADQIQILEGLEAVRKRPGYIPYTV